MRIWRCQKTPIADDTPFAPMINVSSNLCQEIVAPSQVVKDFEGYSEYARFLSEPGWLISIMIMEDPCPVREEMVEWLNNDLGERYNVTRYHHFSFYTGLELKLNSDEDMALFKLKFGEYFTVNKFN